MSTTVELSTPMDDVMFTCACGHTSAVATVPSLQPFEIKLQRDERNSAFVGVDTAWIAITCGKCGKRTILSLHPRSSASFSIVVETPETSKPRRKKVKK